MEQQLAPAELLRFLQAEAETLQQMQAKISNELHHLQVEEEVYVRTLDRLNQSNSVYGDATNTGHQAGVELLEALNHELAPAAPPGSVVPPVPILPVDSALPATQLAITATEAEGDRLEGQLAAPSGAGLVSDEDEYELLDTLESEDE